MEEYVRLVPKKSELNETVQIVQEDDEMMALINDIMNEGNLKLLMDDETESE